MNDLEMLCQCGRDPQHTVGWCKALQALEKKGVPKNG